MGDETEIDTGAEETGERDVGGRIPKYRFDNVVQERNTLRKENAALRDKAGGYDAVVKERDTYKEQISHAEAKWAAEVRLAELGFDADGREVARLVYGRLPATDRPEIGEWLLKAKEEPEKAPRPLRPYLQPEPKPEAKAEAEDAKAAAKEEPKAPPPPPLPRASTPATPGGAAPASGGPTTEAIAAAVEHAKKTGDWSKYNALLGRGADWKPGQR